MPRLSECEKGYRRWIAPELFVIIPLQKAKSNPHTYHGSYKGHAIQLSRETWKSDWYIQVTAPSGSMAYDGWWKDSAGKPIREAVMEAIHGACIDPKLK